MRPTEPHSLREHSRLAAVWALALFGVRRKGTRTKTKECIGKSAGGLSTKIHAVCDALGNPTQFYLTSGEAHDLNGADALLPDVEADAFLADRAYDAQERVIDKLQKKGCEVVIPSTGRRKQAGNYDQHLYQARHLIENFFARLKQYRGIATRYDKRAVSFLGSVYLAASIVWLN